jgi:hypothetical protein
MPKRSHGKLRSGIEATDEVLDRMAVEAEAGLDVTKLRQRGRPPLGTSAAQVRHVRLDPELAQALEARAESDRRSVSEVMREAIRQYLAAGPLAG